MKYQAHQEYKDSGVEWLGAIPQHWQLNRIKHIAELTPKKPNLHRNLQCSFVPMEKLKTNSIVLDEERLIDDVYDGYTYFQNDDILMAKVTPCFENKNIAVAKELINQVGFGSSEIYVLRVNKKTLNRYLYYRLQEDSFMDIATAAMTGAGGLKRVPSEVVNNFTAAFPFVDEQKKIANFLDHETAIIDNLIEKQQQLIKLLKEKRQAVISHAVTKGLNPNAPMRDSGVEWLGEVPEHWSVCKLKHIISSLESGVSVNAADIPAQAEELGVLKTSCVYTRTFRFEENKTVVKNEYNRVKCPVRKGSIIISRMNTPELVGASALVESDQPGIFLPDRLWQTVFSDENKKNPKFISFFMMIKGFRNQISLAAEGASSSMQNIAKDDYLSINIAFPDIEEQCVIIDHLENRLGYLKKLEKCAYEAIKLIQERRTALISAAVTGKIDVRNWVAPAHPCACDISASLHSTSTNKEKIEASV